MSATILNGAVIGQGCLIGAGALVTEGKVIPDRTLVVGTPAKVVRDLTEAEVDGMLKSATNYQANARRFVNGLEAQ
jgi:carbonic anhydrase/acetyltransferase-like protein (isoleucine patch superfamily)